MYNVVSSTLRVSCLDHLCLFQRVPVFVNYYFKQNTLAAISDSIISSRRCQGSELDSENILLEVLLLYTGILPCFKVSDGKVRKNNALANIIYVFRNNVIFLESMCYSLYP
jgi:hypothetical protein